MNIKKSIVTIALFALLVANLGGAHGHYCFDGQEPAFSVHFDNLVAHVDHVSDEQTHNDTDMESGSQILIKFFQTDFFAFLPLLLTLFLWPLFNERRYAISYTPADRHKPAKLLPPLRAPPGTF